MKLLLHETAWEQLVISSRDRVTSARIYQLIDDIRREPYAGLGKPERLRGTAMRGWWSRRITEEHRLVYRVVEDRIEITRCKGYFQ